MAIQDMILMHHGNFIVYISNLKMYKKMSTYNFRMLVLDIVRINALLWNVKLREYLKRNLKLLVRPYRSPILSISHIFEFFFNKRANNSNRCSGSILTN